MVPIAPLGEWPVKHRRNFHVVDDPIRYLQDNRAIRFKVPISGTRLPTPAQLRDEMKALVRRAAEPARPGESVKAEISRAARVLGLSYGRAKRYWYGEIQVPPADGKWTADAVFAEPGTYVLRAVASDGSLFSYDNVTVTVTP